MTPGLPDSVMEALSRRVAARIGLRFERTRWEDLTRSLAQAARESGEADPQAMLLRWLDGPTPADIDALAQQLTVGETYFFREPAAFDVLERELLPPLIETRRAQGRQLRIWSAGCCTGEECYTLAILLHRLIPDLAEWNVFLLGTDIHPGFLARAAEGVYNDWSFRGVPEALQRIYFEPDGRGQHAVRTELKRLVTWRRMNLAEEPDVGADFDLVLCRHVLMYFEAAQARLAVARIHRVMRDGAWLLVGAAETGHGLFDDFAEQRFGDMVFYRRPAAPQVALRLNSLFGKRQPADNAAASLALAIRRCVDAIDADKCDASLHYRHALLLERAGERAAARAALRRTLFLDREFVLAHVALGQLGEILGDDGATRHFSHALRLLERQAADAVVRGSDGLSARRLSAMLQARRVA